MVAGFRRRRDAIVAGLRQVPGLRRVRAWVTHLGEALGRAGRWPEAAEAFREAARLRPSCPEPQGNLVLAPAPACSPGSPREPRRRPDAGPGPRPGG